MAWEHFGVLLEELENVAVETDLWATVLELKLSSLHDRTHLYSKFDDLVLKVLFAKWQTEQRNVPKGTTPHKLGQQRSKPIHPRRWYLLLESI